MLLFDSQPTHFSFFFIHQLHVRLFFKSLNAGKHGFRKKKLQQLPKTTNLQRLYLDGEVPLGQPLVEPSLPQQHLGIVRLQLQRLCERKKRKEDETKKNE